MLLPGTSLQRCAPYSVFFSKNEKKSSTGRYADSVAGLLAAGKKRPLLVDFTESVPFHARCRHCRPVGFPFPSFMLRHAHYHQYLSLRILAATATIRWLRRSIDNHPSFPSHDRTDRSRGFPRSPLFEAPRPRGERERHDLHRLVALAGTT